MKRILLILLALSATACSPNSARLDVGDERDRRFRKAQAAAEVENWSRAATLYAEALKHKPKLARAHLELALIESQHLKHFAKAIYHYERYLELRPESEKRDLIRSWIRQAEISLAAGLSESAAGVDAELIRLKRENNLLRKQLDALRGTTRQPSPAPEVAKPVIRPKEPMPKDAVKVNRIQVPPPQIRTYQVLPGDTLSRIAKSVYGDSSKWRLLYDANRDTMRNENDLKAGENIRIPKIPAEG